MKFVQPTSQGNEFLGTHCVTQWRRRGAVLGERLKAWPCGVKIGVEEYNAVEGRYGFCQLRSQLDCLARLHVRRLTQQIQRAAGDAIIAAQRISNGDEQRAQPLTPLDPLPQAAAEVPDLDDQRHLTNSVC